MKFWTTRMILLAIGATMAISLVGCGGKPEQTVDNTVPVGRGEGSPAAETSPAR